MELFNQSPVSEPRKPYGRGHNFVCIEFLTVSIFAHHSHQVQIHPNSFIMTTTFRTSHCSPSFEVAPNEDNRRTEMLASSMMLVAISENATNHTGYNSSYSSMNSRKRSCTSTGSGDSLSGWGSSITRKSYKVDLSNLANESVTPAQDLTDDSSSSDIDEWGFFDLDN